MGLMARGEVYQCLTDVVRRFSCHLTRMDKCINHYRFYVVSENFESHSDRSVKLAYSLNPIGIVDPLVQL